MVTLSEGLGEVRIGTFHERVEQFASPTRTTTTTAGVRRGLHSTPPLAWHSTTFACNHAIHTIETASPHALEAMTPSVDKDICKPVRVRSHAASLLWTNGAGQRNTHTLAWEYPPTLDTPSLGKAHIPGTTSEKQPLSFSVRRKKKGIIL